ncbi:MAG TPA: DNA/RNA non-specific endonuclease [Luteimonas sp.]|nr:DNA/RNA non-specific endonuclease [Luteimonas sp.]
MSFETFRFPPPLPPPVSDWMRALASRLADVQAAGFDEALLAADPAEVEFALDATSLRITGESTQQWNTSYSVSGGMQVSAPGVDAQSVPVRYEVTLRNENASPAQMRAVNPFDPATIPDRTRIEVYGRDYAGTPLEASFRALADANDLASIDDLRLSLEMTADGELRVMIGANRLFDAPRDGGPASLPADREDFTRHTTILEDPRGADRAGYTQMLLDGSVPDDTVRIEEDVAGQVVTGIVTEAGSGEANTVTWTLDDSGRPVSADATLTWEPSSQGRDSDRIEANAQSRFRSDNDMKGSGDDVGHLIAYRFVNGHGPVNMFPQESQFNQRVYAGMEQEWSDWLAEGMEVRIEITLGPDNVRRPDQVRVDYEVIDPATGKAVYDPQLIVFDNEAGQVFDRIARRDMDDMIEGAS